MLCPNGIPSYKIDYIPSTGIPLNTWKQMKFLGT